MSETESPQTWVSTGRGGAGNFPYTPRALSKRPVTLDAPQGREVDFRKQGIARSGRGGVGYWGPSMDEGTKQAQEEEFERDQEIIKNKVLQRQSIVTDGTYVWKSGRGGAGNVSSPVERPLLPPPAPAADGSPSGDRVHSFGRGGGNYRYGDAIPLVDLNRIETQERVDAKSRPHSTPTRPSDESSPLATLAGYANALFTALTPAENRVEDMTRASPSSPSSPRTSCTPRRTSMGGGRGGAGNIGCASCPPEDARTTRAGSLASSNRFLPRTASSRAENQYSAYSSASCAAAQQGYDPERPPASSSRGVGSSSSPWA